MFPDDPAKHCCSTSAIAGNKQQWFYAIHVGDAVLEGK